VDTPPIGTVQAITLPTFSLAVLMKGEVSTQKLLAQFISRITNNIMRNCENLHTLTLSTVYEQLSYDKFGRIKLYHMWFSLNNSDESTYIPHC
jgi:hypothetical protein